MRISNNITCWHSMPSSVVRHVKQAVLLCHLWTSIEMIIYASAMNAWSAKIIVFRDLCTEDDFAFRPGKNARNEGVYAYK